MTAAQSWTGHDREPAWRRWWQPTERAWCVLLLAASLAAVVGAGIVGQQRRCDRLAGTTQACEGTP